MRPTPPNTATVCRLGLLAIAGFLLPAPAAAGSLTLDSSPVVLGKVESVGVTIRLEERAGTEDRPLRLSVNVGSFGPVNRVGPGEYRSTYVPPSTRFPQVALIAAWRETGPDAPIDFLQLPLHGITKIEVQALPNSDVDVEIGSESFGPVTTNQKGLAVVPLVVPPGVPEALVKVKDRAGVVTKRRTAVAVPPYNRLTMALVPHALLANGEDWARVEVFYSAGTPVPPEKIQLRASLGATSLMHSEQGRTIYKYLAPAGSTEKEVSFTVSVEGDPVARGSAELSLGLPPAAMASVIPPEKPIVCDGHSSAPVTIRVFDARGLGLPKQQLEVLASGRPLPPPQYKGNGEYETRLVAPTAYPAGGLIQISATVALPEGGSLTGLANYQVLALPVPKSVQGQLVPTPVIADGRSRAMVSLDVRDSAGLPLKGAQLILLASHGTVDKVIDLGDGRYRAEYLAPSTLPPGGEAFIKIVDSSGAFETAITVPLRSDQRLLLGARAGFHHSLGDLVGPRIGLDAFSPVRAGELRFGLGLSAMVARASQTVADPSGSLKSESQATFFPLALRLGYEAYVSRALAIYAGVGGIACLARVKTSLNGAQASKVGFGGLGFVSGAFTVGPGQAFVDLSIAQAPVEHADFRLEAGGIGLEAGYRLGLF